VQPAAGRRRSRAHARARAARGRSLPASRHRGTGAPAMPAGGSINVGVHDGALDETAFGRDLQPPDRSRSPSRSYGPPSCGELRARERSARASRREAGTGAAASASTCSGSDAVHHVVGRPCGPTSGPPASARGRQFSAGDQTVAACRRHDGTMRGIGGGVLCATAHGPRPRPVVGRRRTPSREKRCGCTSEARATFAAARSRAGA
jgi:hypothetical protein